MYGGAVGYALGPLSIASGIISSNNGNLVILKQVDQLTYEIWFFAYGYGQCCLEVSGLGLNGNSITYDGDTTNALPSGKTLVVPIYTLWNSSTLQFDAVDQSLKNYYTRYTADNTFQTIASMSQYFTKTQVTNITLLANYYTKTTVDSYIDAKIDSQIVYEMINNSGGHNYLIATDTSTSTTDLSVILNDTKRAIVKFDITGSRFYYPLVANTIATIDSNNNTTMILNNAACIFNVPVACTNTLTATNLYTKTDIDNNIYSKIQVKNITGLINYYTSVVTDTYIDAKIDQADVDKIIYTADNRNYITAVNGTNNITQLVIEADGEPLVDVDRGALTSYVNVVGPNLRQTYTYNSGGTAQWIYLGYLNTTQTGMHLKFEITACSGYNGNAGSSNFSTVHFKTANGVSITLGHNGQPFLGDCIRFDTGADVTLDFRVEQYNTMGSTFNFYLYAGAFSGTSIVEITGGSYGFIPNHTFTWVGQKYAVIPDTVNWITATKSVIYSSTQPPTISSIIDLSNYITGVQVVTPDTRQNIKLTSSGHTLSLDYSSLLETLGRYTLSSSISPSIIPGLDVIGTIVNGVITGLNPVAFSHAFSQSVALDATGRTLGIIKEVAPLVSSGGVPVYVVDSRGNSYPLEMSDTISITQDPYSLHLFLNVIPSYATTANPTFTGTVAMNAPLNIAYNQTGGTIQVAPTTDGYQTTIGFYRHVDKSNVIAGCLLYTSPSPRDS